MVALAAVPLLPTTARAIVVPGQPVVREGEQPPGAPAAIDTINAPFAEASGVVAFRGNLTNGDAYLFRDTQVIWLNSDDPVDTLTGGEAAMGTSPGGGFIYSPNWNGADSVYTDQGLLMVENTQAPGQAVGTNSTFHSRPAMTTSGQAWWVSGINASGGTATELRVLLRSPTATFADTVVVLQGGDMVGGFTLGDTNGIDFDFLPSLDDQHLIAVLDMDTGVLTNDGFVYVDGALVAREDDPNGSGDDWDNFDIVAINNSGNYAFTGDTNGAALADEFIAYNGQIVLREGDLVGGITLTSTASLRFMGLSNTGIMTHAWGYSGGNETVFFSCNPADLANSSVALLTTDDELDTNGDGIGDGLFVTDFNASSTTAGRPIGDDGSIYLDVDITEGGVSTEAMIRLQAVCCGNGFTDPGEQCDDGNVQSGDGCSALCVDEDNPCGNGMPDPGEQCDDGNLDNTDACLDTCVAATCGDGFTQVGVEDCDDGNADDTDACLGTCVAASCGDGFTQVGVEACDDGNADDTDDCPTTCEVATCGDGFVQAGVETCDDGNVVETDACINTCEDASCGDGILWDGVEMCDDGNRDDGDDCPGSCAPATCGDGFVQTGVEECDDGNAEQTDDCLETCVAASCGDGFVQDGVEDCDDGDADNDDDCLDTCVAASCGDGFILRGTETCDDGNDVDTDECPTTCEPAVCGDGFVQEGVEECDDGNEDGSDDCSNTCELNDEGNTGDTGTADSSGGNADGTGTPADGTGDSGDDSSTGNATTPGGVDDDGGCSCSSPGRDRGPRGLMGLLLSLGLLGATRRRRRAASRPA